MNYVLNIYRGFLGHEQTPNGKGMITSEVVIGLINELARLINTQPISVQEWMGFLDDVEEYKKAKKEARVQVKQQRPQYFQPRQYMDRGYGNKFQQMEEEKQDNVDLSEY
ncbi:hypothetical protein QTN25_009741 [Entamoeba marina]